MLFFLFFHGLKAYGNLGLKFILSIVMIYVAFQPKTIKDTIKKLLVFYLTSFAFGGCALALLYFLKPEDIFARNGILIGTYPVKVAILGGLIGFCLIVITFKVVKSKIQKKDMFCKVIILFKEKQTEVTAMIDTGNLLRDPITKMSVIVVEKNSLADLVPEAILNHIQELIGGEAINLEASETEYLSKFRIIPFSSVGKQHGLLIGFKADNIKIQYNENEQNLNNVIVGIYDKELSKSHQYTALIGLGLLDGEEIENESYRDIKVKY